MTSADLEQAAATAVGQLVLDLSRLEFNISLYLRGAMGGSDPEGANAVVSRLAFKAKLDALEEVVAHKFAAQPQASVELSEWLQPLERVRKVRNSFVHGRWGTHATAQQMINVAPGLPGARPQRELRYNISELRGFTNQVQAVAKAFYKWSRKWPL